MDLRRKPRLMRPRFRAGTAFRPAPSAHREQGKSGDSARQDEVFRAREGKGGVFHPGIRCPDPPLSPIIREKRNGEHFQNENAPRDAGTAAIHVTPQERNAPGAFCFRKYLPARPRVPARRFHAAAGTAAIHLRRTAPAARLQSRPARPKESISVAKCS